MREIKFRAWDKELNKMFNVLEMHFHNGGIDVVEYEPFTKPIIKTYPSEDIELMQFTGLKDKNGVEIYEGDDVKFYYKDGTESGEIKYLNSQCRFVVCFDGDNVYGFDHTTEKEVVGNIHENPDLLK